MSEFDRLMRDEIAEGERWLASFATPEPSAACVAKTKRAVRAALTGSGEGPALGRWSVWHGVLAAAASLALAITIGWHSARQNTRFADAELTGAEAQYLADAGQEAQTLSDLDSGLTSLETWSADESWNVDAAASPSRHKRAIASAKQRPCQPVSGSASLPAPRPGRPQSESMCNC